MMEGLVDYELEGMWEEMVITSFIVLSWHLPQRTEGNHEKHVSGW
jgi:hypothetical protein